VEEMAIRVVDMKGCLMRDIDIVMDNSGPLYVPRIGLDLTSHLFILRV
jgi:hypothetical protein